MSFLKEFVFYGLPFNFKLFNRSVYKRSISGLISLSNLEFFVLCFIYLTKDFYLR
jgi:hypothetical protein